MKDDTNILSSNLQINQNNKDDFGIKKMQHNLIMMGFDIEMINKIINIFNIKTEDEAIDYLIKTEDGMWNHPFIPKEEEFLEEQKNILLDQPKNVMNNVFSKLKNTAPSEINKDVKDDNIIIKEKENDLIKINEDICEICGESKNFHLIKEFKNHKNDTLEEDINNILNDDIIIFDEEDQLLNKNINENNNNDKNNTNMKENEEVKEEENEEEEIDSNPNECKICMGDLENPVEIQNCKHKFCRDCFHSYLVNLITNNQIDQIPCPKNKCKNKNLSEEFFSNFLLEHEYYKYRQFKAQNEIARDSKKVFCPLCDSYADIGEGQADLLDSNNPDYIKSTLKCQKGHEFCSCGRSLHEGDCYHDEKEFKDFLVDEKIKKCPKCGFLIKKLKGCNHMTCGNPICRYEFCWLCMQEAVPNHFDYGPCAGKQFFDPESFSYRLKLSHPKLYILYTIFTTFISLILIIIGGMAVPGIGLAVLVFLLIFEEDALQNYKTSTKIIIFLGYACLGFALENIIYIAWGLVFAALGMIIVALIIELIFAVVKNILKCIFCGCPDEAQNPPLPDNNALIPNDISI